MAMVLSAVKDSVVLVAPVWVMVAPAASVMLPGLWNADAVSIVTLVPAFSKVWISPLLMVAVAAVGVNTPPMKLPPAVAAVEMLISVAGVSRASRTSRQSW